MVKRPPPPGGGPRSARLAMAGHCAPGAFVGAPRTCTHAMADALAAVSRAARRALRGETGGWGPDVAVVACVLALKGNDVAVLSFAEGTKFVQAKGEAQKDVVRDCHAEVLSRRALKRLLMTLVAKAAPHSPARPPPLQFTDGEKEALARANVRALALGEHPTLLVPAGDGRFAPAPDVSLLLFTSSVGAF